MASLFATPPETGRDFHAARVYFGVSLRAVASQLHISPATLMRWECDCFPVSPAKANAWRRALGTHAVDRIVALQRGGVSASQLQHTDLGALAMMLGGAHP